MTALVRSLGLSHAAGFALRLAVLRGLGAAFFALGAIGIVLPLLPTTGFWILAAGCWAKSDPELTARLLAHPRFGPPLRDWLEHRVMSRRAKAFAIGGMGTGFALSAWTLGFQTPVLALAGIPMAAAALWIATRRERPGA